MKNNKWTYDNCKVEVQKLTHYNQLQGKRFYSTMLKNGWISDLTQHLIKNDEYRTRIFNYEHCKAETQKLTYYSELQGTSLYNALKKHTDWLTELTSHLIRKQKPCCYWHNKERCKKEALKYKTRAEFIKGSPSAHGAAIRNGWLDEMYSHMEFVQLPNGYWKPEMIIECAKRYKNPKEWVANDAKSYQAAVKLNMMDECMKHMSYIFKPNGWWTYERCKNAVAKYDTLKELRDSVDSGAYVAIMREGWNELILDLKRSAKPFTLADCKKEALKYNSRAELINCNASVYHKIRKMKWDNECYSHMKRKMTLKQRHIYSFEFSDNHVYIGLTCQLERRMKVHLGLEDKNNPERQAKSSVFCHMTETELTPVFKQLTAEPLKEADAPAMENFFIKKYRESGWVVLNKAPAGSLGSMRIKWTDKRLFEIASQCTTRTELFSKIPPSVRKTYKQNNTWQEVCSKLIFDRRVSGDWNDVECISESKKYKSKSEFQKNCSGGYKYAKRNELLNKLFTNRT